MATYVVLLVIRKVIVHVTLLGALRWLAGTLVVTPVCILLGMVTITLAVMQFGEIAPMATLSPVPLCVSETAKLRTLVPDVVQPVRLHRFPSLPTESTRTTWFYPCLCTLLTTGWAMPQ